MSARGEWLQTQDVHQRAASLVISAIARRPQEWSGAMLVADALMCELDGGVSHRRTGVMMTDMATVKPDGGDCAARINKIHERFGIDYHVEPDEAINYVQRCGYLGLECIRRATLFHCLYQKIDIPMQATTVIVPLVGFDNEIPTYNLGGVPALQEFLLTHEDPRFDVATDIMEDAEKIARSSRVHQAGVVTNYHYDVAVADLIQPELSP